MKNYTQQVQVRGVVQVGKNKTDVESSTFVIYEEKTTLFVRIMRNGYWQDASYKGLSAAKAAFTRLQKEGKVNIEEYSISEAKYFHEDIELYKPVRNNITGGGKRLLIAMNTPASCDPSTETYHSM